jgi:hypothetical protein
VQAHQVARHVHDIRHARGGREVMSHRQSDSTLGIGDAPHSEILPAFSD